MARERVDYFDMLKVSAMFFVCYLHFDLLNDGLMNNFSIMICTAGVPVFFMVNGALLLNAPFDMKKHMKRVGWVTLSYFLWRIITLVGLIFILNKSFGDFNAVDLLQYAIGGTVEGISTGHFWFMNTLLAIYIIFPLLKICFDHPKAKVILTVFCMILFVLRYGVMLFNVFSQILNCYAGLPLFSFSSLGSYNIFGYNGTFVLYFILGAILHKYFYIEQIKKRYFKMISVAAVIIGWILFFLEKAFETGATGPQHGVIDDGYTRVSSFIMSIGFFCLFIGVKFRYKIIQKIVSAISQSTLCIYYLHWLMGFVMLHLGSALDPFKSIWLNILKALVMVMVGTLVGVVLRLIPGVKKLV